MLELITGLSPLIKDSELDDLGEVQVTSLANWVQPYIDDVTKMIDPKVGSEYNLESAQLFVRLAKSCTERYGKYRPFMDEVCFRLVKVRNLAYGYTETIGEEPESSGTASFSAPIQISAITSPQQSDFVAPVSEAFFQRP